MRSCVVSQGQLATVSAELSSPQQREHGNPTTCLRPKNTPHTSLSAGSLHKKRIPFLESKTLQKLFFESVNEKASITICKCKNTKSAHYASLLVCLNTELQERVHEWPRKMYFFSSRQYTSLFLCSQGRVVDVVMVQLFRQLLLLSKINK